MNKICVCIEGQLRGSKTCGPTIKKHLIEPLNADLYFFIQNYEYHDSNNLKYYGEYKDLYIYKNPDTFEDIFNNLCDYYGYEKNIWKETFRIIKNENYTDGYDKPGVCMRRMYNRYLIYENMKLKNYEWFIISRSDLYFVQDIQDITKLDKNTIYATDIAYFNGINNNMMIFHKNMFEKTLTYIKLFLNNSFSNYFINNNLKDSLNEELFFSYCIDIYDISFGYIKNITYKSADDIDDYTTCGKICKSNTGDLYKYEDEYEQIKLDKYLSVLDNKVDKYYLENIVTQRDKCKKNGIFIDIGAYDGIKNSNTYYLENYLDWKGICIEPNPHVFSKYLVNNRKCILYNSVISNKSDIDIEFIIPKNDDTLGKIKENEILENFDVYHVKTLNMDLILDRHGVTNIDYINIHTNGNELRILEGINFDKHKIFYININNNKNIEDFLLTKNYIKCSTDKEYCGYIYIKNESINSFSLLDTLVTYKMSLENIFKYIENKYDIKNFYKNRIDAYILSDGTYPDIYKKLQTITGYDLNYIEKIKVYELDIVYQNLIPIISNIKKIKDGDFIIDNLNFGLDFSDIVTKKFNKKIKIGTPFWCKKMTTLFEIIQVQNNYFIKNHMGSTMSGDSIPCFYNRINFTKTKIYKHTSLEKLLPNELSYILREFRLLCVYDEYSDKYRDFVKQCTNIILLSLLCVQTNCIVKNKGVLLNYKFNILYNFMYNNDIEKNINLNFINDYDECFKNKLRYIGNKIIFSIENKFLYTYIENLIFDEEIINNFTIFIKDKKEEYIKYIDNVLKNEILYQNFFQLLFKEMDI